MRVRTTVILSLVLVCSTACDTVQPSREGVLVVEAFLDAGRPLPAVRVSRTQTLSAPLTREEGAVSDALVELILSGQTIDYKAVPDTAGLYRPDPLAALQTVPPLATFLLRVQSDSDRATVTGRIPSRITIENVIISVPEEAIEAILVDTLDIGLDSLNLGLDAQEGLIYPVQVSVEWMSPLPEPGGQEEYWIETRLDPVTDFSSSIIDFFLLPDQILPESTVDVDFNGRLIWTGVYAVPVETADQPFPEHDLKISILRSDRFFARYAASRNDPAQREPLSNVSGGIGIVSGISIDSVRVIVK